MAHQLFSRRDNINTKAIKLPRFILKAVRNPYISLISLCFEVRTFVDYCILLGNLIRRNLNDNNSKLRCPKMFLCELQLLQGVECEY
jgi:hypothetical protein